MDFKQKKPQDLQSQRKAVENELNRLTQQAFEIDQKIRLYLVDRNKFSCPKYKEFVDKVQSYHVVPPILNKHLEMILDNLQWKVYYYQRAWNQLLEKVYAPVQQERTAASGKPATPSGEQEKKKKPPKGESKFIVESISAIQQIYRADSNESKDDFNKRMFREYNRLNNLRKPGQEIVATYYVEEKKYKLELKDK